MFCGSCGKENHQSSNFCRFCGKKIAGTAGARAGMASFVMNKKRLLIAGGAICIILIAIAAWPAISRSLLIRQTISKAQDLEGKGLYHDALSVLADAKIQNAFASSSDEINALVLHETQLSSWDDLYAQASTSIAKGDYDGALASLQKIDPSYPGYGTAKDMMIDAQKHIQDELNSKIKSAEQRAAAQKAAAEQAQSAAAAAAAKATQATSQTSMLTFRNQLRNIHNNFNNNCLGVLTKAIQLKDAGESYSVYLGAAAGACGGVQADAKNLNDSYNNMPASYTSAASAMQWEAYYASQSVTAFAGNDYSSASYYISEATPYESEVAAFLAQ